MIVPPGGSAVQSVTASMTSTSGTSAIPITPASSPIQTTAMPTGLIASMPSTGTATPAFATISLHSYYNSTTQSTIPSSSAGDGQPPASTTLPVNPSYSSFFLGIVPPSVKGGYNDKRDDPALSFVGAGGPPVVEMCSDATVWMIRNGGLFSEYEQVSTSPGVVAQPFVVSPEIGSITTTFNIIDGYLDWHNAAFGVLGFAEFCQGPTGQVEILFDRANNAANLADCSPVSLYAYPSE